MFDFPSDPVADPRPAAADHASSPHTAAREAGIFRAPWKSFPAEGSPGFLFTRFFRPLGAALAFTALALHGAEPSRVAVAAAANLIYALDELHAAFRAATPGVEIVVATGASGSLVAQVGHGAPYDVFLSADLEYAQALVNTGHADPASLTVFATGRLVLWSVNPRIDVASLESLTAPEVRKIAIANLETAPYGRAARQALERQELWSQLTPKFVFGENVSQTAQFVETGSADAGFVALSLVLSPRLRDRGRWWIVPQHLYAPLEQAAVLTTRGRSNPAARQYLEFLRSDAARAVFERFGYAVPAPHATAPGHRAVEPRRRDLTSPPPAAPQTR